MEHVLAYFEAHPKETVVFETTNEFLFKHEGDAAAHAATLKEKEQSVVKHEKDVITAKIEVLVAKAAKPKNKKELEAEAKALAEKEQAEADADEKVKAAELLAKGEGGKTVNMFPAAATTPAETK